MQTSEYQKQAEDFLNEAGIDFSFVLIGSDCPKFCTDAEASRDMDKVDVYPRKSHIHGKHYRITFQRRGHSKGKEASGYFGSLTIDFWNSYSDEEENAFRHGDEKQLSACRENIYWDKYRGKRGPLTHLPMRGPRKAPSAYDVLACLTKGDPGSFENFCGDYGYDSDSRKAESTYRAVQAEWKKVAFFFSQEEIEKLQEVQ